ncbi:MAG: transposase [Acidimicrobiales bacterium]
MRVHLRRITGALKPVYTAPSVEAAAEAMDNFELEYGERYPGIVAVWRSAWERFIPFLAYPPVIRKVVYTTDERIKSFVA